MATSRKIHYRGQFRAKRCSAGVAPASCPAPKKKRCRHHKLRTAERHTYSGAGCILARAYLHQVPQGRWKIAPDVVRGRRSKNPESRRDGTTRRGRESEG